MSSQSQTPRTEDTTVGGAGLSPEQLDGEQAHDLPDREAMSLLDVGGLSGAFPVPIDPQPPAVLSDPSTSIPLPSVPPLDVDLTNADGNVGDISDVTDVGDVASLEGPDELTDLQGSVAGSVDAGGPAGLMQPSPTGSSTLA